MKLQSLKIKNFRTLEDLSINFEGYFASISGRNNAGKTSVIKAVRSLLKGTEREYSFFEDEESISYANGKTQWVTNEDPITLEYGLSATKNDDPGLHSFMKKIAEIEDLPVSFCLRIIVILNKKNERKIQIYVDGNKIEKYAVEEIYKRLSLSNIVFLHNSTGGGNRFYYPTGAQSFHEMILSKDEKEELKKEQECKPPLISYTYN